MRGNRTTSKGAGGASREPTPPSAMILAAGRGTRLRPITDHTPKPLVRVAGHPLIAYGLRLLRHSGFEEVVVNVHHLRERLIAELGDGGGYGVKIRYSVEETLLDTGGGIRHAARLLGDGAVVVMNSDVICEVPIADVLRAHAENRALVTLVLRADPEAARYGTFGIDDQGRVRRFLGIGSRETSLREYMFASVQVIDQRAIEMMPEGQAFGTMRDLYPRLFREGFPFFGYVYQGRWFTADNASDLARAESALSGAGVPAYMLDVAGEGRGP